MARKLEDRQRADDVAQHVEVEADAERLAGAIAQVIGGVPGQSVRGVQPRVGEDVDHLYGILGGFVWGVGGAFNFIAADKVGVPISYAIGQSAPMVAAAWGVFVWKEFRGANSQAKMYLALMFACYIVALLVISRAYTS